MILLGNVDLSLRSDNLEPIIYIDDIKNTKPNSVVSFDYNHSTILYCNSNNIQYAVYVSCINEIIFSNILNAKYIIVNEDISIKAQKIADDYMYDSKIIVEISSLDQLETVVSNSIDGAILK
jgi:hypothetical protein